MPQSTAGESVSQRRVTGSCPVAGYEPPGWADMMAGYKHNSEWDRRLRELQTDQGLVGNSMNDPDIFMSMMSRYQGVVTGYVASFLLRHKLVSDEKEADEASALIWQELHRVLPGTLAEKWGRGKKSFRDLLRKGVHRACHTWSKPATRALLSPGPTDDAAWKEGERRMLLAKALEKLKAYQREHERKGTLYYVIFRLSEEHKEESYDELDGRLAALPGGRRLGSAAFRKAIGRARDQFGRYLFEEVAAWVAERDTPSPEKYVKVFEELDLMDDYARKSKSCRWLLGLEDSED